MNACGRYLGSLVVIVGIVVCFAAPASAQMPDPKQMSGVPLPVGDLPVGTVTVRVIRGQLTNPMPGQVVQLTGEGTPKTATTDDAGRAQFSGLAPGTPLKASVTVANQTIESREFTVPATGGVRMMLVVSDAGTKGPAAGGQPPAQPPAAAGTIVLGAQSRFVIELGDEGLNVFNILQVSNTAQTPVRPSEPLVFDLPEGATGPGALEGSAPNTVVAGQKVTVGGPFPPGNTLVQFGYSLPFGRETMTVVQRMPVPLTQFSLIAQKTGSIRVSSPQLAAQREMSAEGQTYIVGQGPAVRAGDVVSITLSGLPHHPVWPRYVALVLAGGILAAGLWTAARRRPAKEDPRGAKLQARRERLLADMTALEQSRERGAIDESAYAARRRDLMSALEDVYRQLDDRQVA